ncbi:MAG: hypothetical protein H0T83_07205 [Chthoniobacterales bacterium]|nr:hypothetical protein [Chthoniobacterales bacterium]
MKQFLQAGAIMTIALSFATSAHAKVASQSAQGFIVKHEVDVAVDPKTAYAAFINHRRLVERLSLFSGAAKNISIEAKADGCWCEALADGGSVRH